MKKFIMTVAMAMAVMTASFSYVISIGIVNSKANLVKFLLNIC